VEALVLEHTNQAVAVLVVLEAEAAVALRLSLLEVVNLVKEILVALVHRLV
jgi:hypothetical protein